MSAVDPICHCCYFNFWSIINSQLKMKMSINAVCIDTYFRYTFFIRSQHTLHKKEVFGQLNPLEKCFKICYVYGKRKPK